MDLYKDVDTALAEVGIPFYQGMPEFSEFAEPESYISYIIHDKPVFYSSGDSNALTVWLSITVLTSNINNELYQKIRTVLKAHGYEYQDGRDMGNITIYPSKKQRSMDFIKNFYKEK